MLDVLFTIGLALSVLALLVGAYLSITQAIYAARRSDGSGNNRTSNACRPGSKNEEMSGNIPV